MTETLHRPNSTQIDEIAFRDKQLEQLSVFKAKLEGSPSPEIFEAITDNPSETFSVVEQEDTRAISPLSERIRNATDRFANRLEKRAMAKSHDEALKEYRDRDHSGYVDHVANLASSEDESIFPEAKEFNQNLLITEEERSDRDEAREAMLENAEVHLRIFGNIALERSKDAGHIALGMGVLGYQAIQKRVQTASFHHEMNRDRKHSAKQYAKESTRFEKQNAKDNKVLSKQAAKDSRRGAREDRKFESSMKRKETKEKIVGSYEKTVNATTEKAVKSYEKSLSYATTKKKKLGSFAIAAREVGATHTITKQK